MLSQIDASLFSNSKGCRGISFQSNDPASNLGNLRLTCNMKVVLHLPAKITHLSHCLLYKVLDHSHNIGLSVDLPGMHINEVHHARGNITDWGFGDALETWKEIWWVYFQHFAGSDYLWQCCQPVKKAGSVAYWVYLWTLQMICVGKSRINQLNSVWKRDKKRLQVKDHKHHLLVQRELQLKTLPGVKVKQNIWRSNNLYNATENPARTLSHDKTKKKDMLLKRHH